MVEVTVAPMFVNGSGSRTIRIDATTVARLVEAIESKHPGFRDAVTNELGALRPHIGLYVNGERVAPPKVAETRLRAGDRVHILPSVSGG